MLDPVDEIGAKPVGITDDLDGIDPLQQLLEHNPDLETGQRCAETDLTPGAKGEVVVGGPSDVEAKRVLEDLVVVVGRWVPDHDPVALSDGDAPELGKFFAIAIAALDNVDADELAGKIRYVDGRSGRYDREPDDTRLL